MKEREEALPSPCFSQVLILKGVKVLCFDTLLQVFILNGLGVHGKWRGSIPSGLPSRLGASLPRQASRVNRARGQTAEAESSGDLMGRFSRG
jgi:hypothetical protein